MRPGSVCASADLLGVLAWLLASVSRFSHACSPQQRHVVTHLSLSHSKGDGLVTSGR